MPSYLGHLANNLVLANHMICGQTFYDSLYIGLHHNLKVKDLASLKVLTEPSKKYAFGTKRLTIKGKPR